jgi:hypothetical protein
MPFDFCYPVYALWLSCLCPLILAILFMPFDFGYPVHALWFWLSCLCPLAILFMPFDFGYPVYALWLSCSCPLILAILFMPFGFLVPKDFLISWLSNILTLYLMKVIPEMCHALKLISTFLLLFIQKFSITLQIC